MQAVSAVRVLGRATGPAGVHEVRDGAVRRELLVEELGVDRRVQREEGGAEARGESRRRLGHTTLSVGDLGGEAGDEVVHGMAGAQPGDRRQHAEGVAGEEDASLRVLAGAGLDVGRDVVERVYASTPHSA